MYLIPYSTDAPLYHWPYATVGLMVANVLGFIGLVTLSEEMIGFVLSWTILVFGNFNPITWITSNYVHGGIGHLLGNMISMFVFGLIVEGKLGWWKFLLLYHGLGFLQCGVEQTLMIFASEGRSFGASAIIYGLMAMCLVWAPQNNIHCIYGGRFAGGGTFEVPVITFVGISMFIQILFAGLHLTIAKSFFVAMCSEVLHLMGAAVGAAVAVALLKTNLVDCENWDIFNVWAGKHLMSRDERNKEYMQSDEFKAKQQNAREALVAELRQHLAANERVAAWATYKRGLNLLQGFKLDEADHLNLIACMRQSTLVDETMSLMVGFLKTYPQRSANVRLALAQILIEKKERGKQALKVLEKIDQAALDPRYREPLAKMRARAAAMVEEDPYEVAPEDW